MRKVTSVLFLGGFGLLPLWASIVFVYLASPKSQSASEYWAVAPWLIVASLPVSLVTIGIARATAIVYGRTQGTEARKIRVSALTFVMLVCLALSVVGFFWMRIENRDRAVKAEQALAVQFVEKNDAVIRAAGGPGKANLGESSMRDGWPVRYEVVMRGSSEVYAIVDVSRRSSVPVFSLACITTVTPGRREANKDVCDSTQR